MYLFSEDTLIKNKQLLNKKVADLNMADQRVLVIYNEPLTEEISKMLGNMMKACKLQPQDYHVIYFEENPMSWKVLASKLTYIKEVILFGDLEESLNLSLNFQINHPTMFDQKVWIKAPLLNDIYHNDKVKSAFWSQALQPYFT